MRRETANLKLLIQNPVMWFFYIGVGYAGFAAIQVAFVSHSASVLQSPLALLVVLWPMMVGLIVALPQMEVLTKPFSYCLPGHRGTMPEVLFWLGAAMGAVVALLFVRGLDLRGGQVPLVLCSAFSAGLFGYWLGPLFVCAGWCSLPIGAGVIALLFFDLERGVLGRLIVSMPFHWMALGAASSAVMWRLLGRRGLARRYCGLTRKRLSHVWLPGWQLTMPSQTAARKGISRRKAAFSRGLTFFLFRMRKRAGRGAAPHVWGGLADAFGQAASNWKRVVSVFLIVSSYVAFLCWYALPMVGALMLGCALLGVTAESRLPIQSGLLISGGRRQRFWAAATVAAVNAAMLLTMCAVMAAIVETLRPWMPDLTLKDATFARTDRSVLAGSACLWGLPSFIPAGFTIQLLFLGKKTFSKVLWRLCLSLACLAILSTAVFTLSRLGPTASTLGLCLLPLGLWAIFLLVLRRVCMTRCMVGEDKQWYRWGKVVLVGCLLLLPASWYWFEYGATRELRIELAAIRAAGEPVEFEDLAPEPVPDELNAATLYVKAVEILPLKVYSGRDDSQYTRWHRLTAMLGYLSSHEDFRQEHQAEVAEILAGTQEALAICRRASELERCHWERDYSLPAPDFTLRGFPRLRPLARTLCLAAVTAHEAGDDDQALRHIRDCMELAASGGTWRDIFGYLFQATFEAIACEAVETIAPTLLVEPQSPAATRDQVRGLIAMLLDERQFNEGFTMGMMVERCSIYEWFEVMRNDQSVLALAMVSGVKEVVQRKGAYVRASREDSLEKARALYPPKREPVKSRSLSPARMSDLFIDIFDEGNEDSLFALHFETRALRRLTATALAIRLYELDRGRRPETLDQLVPEYLPAVPIDPLATDGRRMSYRPDADSPVVYSVGRNQVDNGGVLVFTEAEPKEIDKDLSDVPVHLNADRPRLPVKLPDPPDSGPQQP